MFILYLILTLLILLTFCRKRISVHLFYYLLTYLCVNFIFETIAHYFAYHNMSNYEVYNYEMIWEVSFYLCLFQKGFTNNTYKKLIFIFITVFLLFAIINLIFFESRKDFNSNTYTVGCILLLTTGMMYLFHDIVKRDDVNPLFFPMFWISLGVLFCYLVNFPFLSNVNQLFNMTENMTDKLAIMNYTVNVLMYVLIGIGIICSKQRA